jgi:hypothetical protein
MSVFLMALENVKFFKIKKTFESAIKTRIAHEVQTTFFLQRSKKELDL